MRILVVDDDALAGDMICALLAETGLEPLLAAHAIEALEQLEAHPDIALIVSDLHMPLMNGIELFRHLRDTGRPQPFVLLSGEEPAALLAQEPGLSACLPKDGDFETHLPAAIRALLNQPAAESDPDRTPA